METLRYDRTKLVAATAVGLFITLVFVWAFADADLFSASRRGRIFATGFGHYVFAPFLIGMGGTFVWRAGALACGTLEAVECTASALFVTGFWGRRRIPWRELVSVTLERNGAQNQLAFAARSGGLFGAGKVRVALGLTRLHPSRIDDFLDRIEQAHADALGASPGRSAVSPRDEADARVPGPAGFDPDEAMARYLARKAAGEAGPGESPVAPQVRPGPPRPAFGRKVG